MYEIIISVALFFALACTSCVTMTIATVATTAYAMAASNTRLKGKTLERIGDKAALMETRDGDIVCIVYPFKEYSDGMKVNAKFRRGGYYEYQDESGSARRVPIYVQSKNLSSLVDTAISLDSEYRKQNQPPVYSI